MTELQNAVFKFLEANPDVSMKDFLNNIKADFKEYKDHLKKDKKNVKSDVIKPLNSYQLFVKEQMKKFKDNDSKLTGKELMIEISVLWKKSKDSSSEPSEKPSEEPSEKPSEEPSEEVFEEVFEDASDKEPEIVKVPNKKFDGKKKK